MNTPDRPPQTGRLSRMESLTSTVEEYLEKLFWMKEAGIDATQAILARAVGVSQPTALEMVRRMTR